MFTGCEKNIIPLEKEHVAVSDLLALSKTEVSNQDFQTFKNVNNYYDVYGEAFYNAFNSALNEYEFNKESTKSSEILIEEMSFIRFLPKDYIKIDTVGINKIFCGQILSVFVKLYVDNNYEIAVPKSILMENYIVESETLSNVDKAFLLKSSSLLRYATFCDYQMNSSGLKKYLTCWTGKLQSLEDSGIVEQILCIADWPMCFGAYLVDCAIDELF